MERKICVLETPFARTVWSRRFLPGSFGSYMIQLNFSCRVCGLYKVYFFREPFRGDCGPSCQIHAPMYRNGSSVGLRSFRRIQNPSEQEDEEVRG